MGRANSPSSRSELKTSNLWCPSAIPAWGCPRSRRTRSSMRSLPRNYMGPVWDCRSAAPSLNRMAAACGLPTTFRAAQVFTSFYPPKSPHMNDAPVASAVSNPHVVLGRPLAALMAGIAHAARLDEQELDLAFGKGLVLDAARDDEHLPRRDRDGAVAKIDPQIALDDEERLVGIAVVMPDEIALQPDDLELIIVHLGDDPRRPALGEQGEFLRQIDRLIVHLDSPSRQRISLPRR